jgi:hypothetical protein
MAIMLNFFLRRQQLPQHDQDPVEFRDPYLEQLAEQIFLHKQQNNATIVESKQQKEDK